ncbi:MAG TPA: CRTAC1 family protein [Planctomycetaceae bacterium]|nr:CRTAC1 family protein [Planctomycetaceae bacterium]
MLFHPGAPLICCCLCLGLLTAATGCTREAREKQTQTDKAAVRNAGASQLTASTAPADAPLPLDFTTSDPQRPRADAGRFGDVPPQLHLWGEIPERFKSDADWFEDVTPQTGIDFAYRNGVEARQYTMLEAYGGGVTLFDFDCDGDSDMFFTGGGTIEPDSLAIGGRRGALFRNDGDWRFTDVTDRAHLADDSLYTHGATAGDFDGDGFPDLFVAGYGGCRLFRNDGDGGFTEVAREMDLDCPGWNMTGLWLDFDRDGLLDLYAMTYADWNRQTHHVCVNDWNYRDLCTPGQFAGSPDLLWRNCGDGTFSDVSREAGLVAGNRGLGVLSTDFDGDLWPDIFVANDAEENLLYFGRPQLPFESDALAAGVAVSPLGEREGSMGADFGDFDGDGRPDIFYTNYTNQGSALLTMIGPRSFVSRSAEAGLLAGTAPWVGFGTGFADFDHDGWLDLFVINGHVNYERPGSRYDQPAMLYRNRAGKRLEDVTASGGPYFSVPHAGRGAAVGDLDGDGALDLVVVHQNQPVAVLKNRQRPPQWVRAALRGVSSSRDAVGARVESSFEGRARVRWVHGGGGYLSHFDPRILLPLEDAEKAELRVTWPAGKTEIFSSLDAQTTHAIVEGHGRPVAPQEDSVQP